MNLNEMFKKYNDNKRLTEDIYRDMKNKIDTIVDEIKNDDETLSLSTIYLGSYKTKTGVEYNNKLYDIDLGIRLNIKEGDIINEKYTAYEEKSKVFNAIAKYRHRIFKVPCLTAEYYVDEKPKYHLDFPIYAYDDTKNVYYLAKGKDENAIWEINEPDKLINYLYFEELDNIQREDYRMTIRFLKLWKSKVFSSDRKVVCPPSIALNLMTRMYFDKFNEKDYIDYLIDIANMFRGLILGTKVYLTLPFKPSSDIFYKINNSDEAYKNVDTLKQRVQFLLDTLNNAKLTAFTSLEEACKLLGKIFPDFPLPDKEEVKNLSHQIAHMEYKFLKYLEQIEQISNIEYIESTTVFVETYKFTYNSSNYRVCFSIYFPFDLPEFFAEQKMKKLHVDQRGKVCYDDVEDLLFDYNDHLDVIKKAFNSFFTIIDYDAHENEYSYEFNDYQRYYKRFDMNRNSYIFGDFRFNTPHLVNKYTHGNQEVFIDIDDKNRDYITHNIENNTLKNVLYIPFKNIPIIPNVNDELFFSDFNDCYDKVDLNKIHKLLKNITEIIYSIKNPNGFYNCVNVKFEGRIKSLNQKIQATSINSINIYDFDFLKERSGSKTRNERILMIGLGSLGSETLYHLCKTGFINIDLCDFDAFYPSNIYRHFLGFNSVFDSFKKELTFGSKVEKLKNEMKNRYPDLNSNIYVKGIHKLLLDNTIDISQYDYIISTTGNTVVNLFLNDYLYKNKISTKLLITWLEPYGVGRHILRVNTAIRGCLQCLILSKNNVHIADENGNYKIRNDNCTGSFSRFGNLDVSKLAVEIVEELLNDNFSMNKHIVRKGSFTDFLQDYHKLTDFSEMSDETIDLKGEDFIYAGCNVCGRHNH